MYVQHVAQSSLIGAITFNSWGQQHNIGFVGLRDRRVGLGMHTLAALPPTLKGRLGLVSLPNFSSVNWAQCRPNNYLIFLLHFPHVDLVFFLVASLNT